MAAVLLGGVSVGLLYGYRYLTISPYFALKTIEIEGNFRLSSREVLDTAGLSIGMNSLLPSLNRLEKQLAANPWVRSVSARRELPDRFIIRLTEKEPRFWVRREGALYYADVYGAVIAPVSSGKFTSFPTLEVEKGAEFMTRQLPDLIRNLAEARLAVDMSSVSLVRLSLGRGVEVVLESNNLTLSIGQEDWSANLERLTATLTDLSRRGELKQVREVMAHDAGVLVVKDKPAADARPHPRGEA
jgi:cell division protein FtsQ